MSCVNVLVCSHCTKISKHEKDLDGHMARVSGTVKQRQCPDCDSFHVNLRSHTLRFYRGVKRSVLGVK